MRGWQANERHTCVLPVVLGLCPKLKYPLLCRGIIIYRTEATKQEKMEGGRRWKPAGRKK